jgi:uncharacterized surface protein with fasciclin (FAS1) repeats
MKSLISPAIVCVVALMLSGCATAPASSTVAETTAANPQLTILNKLIQDAGMTDTLRAAGPLTLFAPSDEAFKAVPAATMEELAKDKARLRAVLAYHVVPGNLNSAAIKNGPVKTAQGSDLALYRAGAFITVESAVVTTPDVTASNGTIQVIDKVLIPR